MSYPFVKQLCVALTDQGVRITVIVPQSITKCLIRRIPIAPRIRMERTIGGEEIRIYSPYVLSFGNLGYKLGLYKYFRKLRSRVISSIIKSMAKKPDVIYGHFWHSAYDGYDIARAMDIPLFVASGESIITLHKKVDVGKIHDFIEYVSGVICVSTKNKRESIAAGLTSENKCVVIPNAIDASLFYKKDKCQLREKFGFSNTDFIVAFVGGFILRKGPTRIAQAISMLNDSDVKVLFFGKPMTNDKSNIPECPGILFRGPVPHDQLSDYLNCADVFVMPTLHEGCCNANIEAMACGLPVISSDLDFNYDILDESCAILIDPMDVNAIADSIRYLKNNPKRLKELSLNAVSKSQDMKIENRAKRIIDFILQKQQER
ncbi:MAG: glycosyltransferase family 4 protein [Prevotella sp.]|nr:glycosyltransferase family 4 protein [Prevotella sp.]